MNEFASRRNKLAAQMQNNSIALLPSGEQKTRNGDAEYPFRQDSNFYYLTGYPEPHALMALCKDSKGNVKYVLFNMPNDPEAEIWNGKRIGQEDACKIYNADEAYDIADIDQVMPQLFANMQVVYFPLARIHGFDQQVGKWVNSAWRSVVSKGAKTANSVTCVPSTFTDIIALISELRLIKSDLEINYMRQAAEISALAHAQVMHACKPEMLEYQLEAVFNAYCLHHGCRGFAYNAIVAGGNNGCTLHYVANDQKLRAGDLVLVDAGGEYNNYAADITRTFPVSGKFSSEQRAIYELVLQAQLAGIEEVKPGNAFDSVQTVMVEIIVAGLLELGILTGNAKQIIQDQEYKQFYMHSSGHWLGLDVHDAGRYKVDNQIRKFVPGMVLTVEPGIYIANTTTGIDTKWLGIAVRIEDDILVTKNGNEVLSSKAPKTVAEIERVAL